MYILFIQHATFNKAICTIAAEKAKYKCVNEIL